MVAGGEPGAVPGSGVPAGGVQPGVEDQGLGAPVALESVVGGMSDAGAAEAREMDEGLRRRAADQELRDELARHDFAGPAYRRFQEELARYGTSVLRAWLYSGWVFKMCAERGYALHPTDAELEELHRDSDARDDLANMTVAVALPRFRERALAGGGWRADGGSALPTYFMGRCLYVFPNEFRRRRVQQEKQRRADRADRADRAGRAGRDPAVEVTGNLWTAGRIREIDPRARAAVALTVDGYSQQEIAELLGKPGARSVEAIMYRWRTGVKKAANEEVTGG